MIGIIPKLELERFGDRLSRDELGIVTIDMRDAELGLVALASEVLKELERLEVAFDEKAKHKFRDAGVLPMLESIGRSRPDEAFAPEYADLWFLYSTIRKRRPGTVIEFGSGWSTYVIARALYENRHGRIASYDASAEWAEVTRDTMPVELAERCTIHCREPVEEYFDDTPVFDHKIEFEGELDFLYLDGPPLTAERQAAMDPLGLEKHFSENATIVIDGRPTNARFLAKNLRQEYRIESESLYFVTEPGGAKLAVTHMSVFERVA